MIRNISFAVLTLLGSSAWANTKQVIDSSIPWAISEVQLQQVGDELSFVTLSDDECVRLSSDSISDIFEGINWSQIVNVGAKVWDIVKMGKPVAHMETPVVHALPKGLQCWNDLEHWQAPRTQTFEVVYKNGFGMEVVKFRFRLHYTYGGGKADRGQYLANVTVLPAELNVSWGYTFDAKVEVANTVNLGTRENPLAGVEMNLRWTVNTVFKESQNSFHFFVQGDGVSRTAE